MLFQLPAIRCLSLFNVLSLTGTLPLALSPSLTTIDLSYTSVGGAIPEWGNSSITDIRLSRTQVTGSLGVASLPCVAAVPPRCALPVIFGYPARTCPVRLVRARGFGVIRDAAYISCLTFSSCCSYSYLKFVHLSDAWLSGPLPPVTNMTARVEVCKAVCYITCFLV